ncbi:NAD(P)/FAD-dependent oxidoreductase [Allorhizobium borbori]|uniref:Glycine/D-amino acid oxidase-like deaminating enzyme n=1 Tax=Allorhizobium borbori TaxID=485907 RepID=A0A7W6K1A2_9HYPH|nr:FAD-binding oxidoreductase [Allorhizobium borbori]MBB4103368.1 glycine/D-amino acid oxidase-like deaminating enzyme [Allorhizobium borbori]
MSRILPDVVVTPQELPAEVDVVIIGGGIIGVSTALSLVERGLRVAVCEKGLIGAEQSARNWGWVRQMGRDAAELPLAIESLRLWRSMNERINGETGFRQAGIAYLCETDADVAMYEDWLKHALPLGLDSRLVTGAALQTLVPGAAKPFKAALYTSSDAKAEPMLAAPAIARGAAAKGAHILTNCAVRTVERTAGRVSSVVTERGEIRCASVVLAGGAWSRRFAGNMGIDFPSLTILGSVARLSSIDGVPDMAVGASNFSFRRRLDGGFTVAQRNANIAPLTPDSFRLFVDYMPTLIKSWRELTLRVNGQFVREWGMARKWSADDVTPFEQVRILDPDPSLRFVHGGIDYLRQAFPVFGAAKLTQMWGGLMDVTPDAVPVIAPVGSLPGFYLCTGFSGHGFGIGPGAGALMADLITGATPCVDPRPFRMERFSRLKAFA